MRLSLLMLAAMMFLAGGCSLFSRNPPASAAPGPLFIPQRGLAGKVVRVNPQARFVVLNFPLGQMPQIEHRMTLYRQGVKVGEVKVTGPQREDNIVADLISGDASVGDLARDP